MDNPKAKNRLHATRVDRIAIVDRPAVPDAQIVVFKRLEDEIVEKGAISFLDLPLANEGASWDAAEARKRVRAWAGGDDIDWAKFRKAFMWYDSENADKEGAYKLPYADVQDGKLVAVPKAIFAIVASVAGARGGVNIPKEDKTKVLNICKKYYKKMDKEFPEVSVKTYSDLSIFEKDFNAGFVFRATEAAVDTLQSEVWDALYTQIDDAEKVIKRAFSDFTDIVLNFLAKVPINKSDAQEVKLTEDDILKPFARGLEIVAMSEGFAYFKNNIAYLVAGSSRLENPDTIIRKIINQFEGFVIGSITEIVANKKEGSVPVFEKEGRIISSARLTKLKQMIGVLTELVKEAESRYSDTTEKEDSDMEMKDILEKLEKLSATVESFTSRFSAIEAAMKEKGMLLTETEVQENKAKEVKLAIEKRAEAAGLPKDSAEDAITKKEQEIADKKKADDDAAMKEAEKKEKERIEAEKKEKDAAEARLAKIEKSIAEIGKVLDVIGKRFGVKTSLDVEIAEKSDEGNTDTFGNAVKGIGKGKK